LPGLAVLDAAWWHAVSGLESFPGVPPKLVEMRPDVPFHRVPVRCPRRVGRVLPVVAVKGIGMDKNAFSSLVDQTGLTLTDKQKSVLFEVYPLFQAMIVRATPPMPREAEPSLIFMPEVK
jgi:hypothetical protein